jgi:hypothetical protein
MIIKKKQFLPTLIIITGRTREIAKTNDAASEKQGEWLRELDFQLKLLVRKRMEAVFRTKSKKCSASVYSSYIRANTDIFVG